MIVIIVILTATLVYLLDRYLSNLRLICCGESLGSAPSTWRLRSEQVSMSLPTSASHTGDPSCQKGKQQSGRIEAAQACPEERTDKSTLALGYIFMKDSKAMHAGKSRVALKPLCAIASATVWKAASAPASSPLCMASYHLAQSPVWPICIIPSTQ